MDKQQQADIINLCKFILSDSEYKKAILFINNGKLNDLRLFIAEKYELLSIVQQLNNDDNVLAMQLQKCDILEDLVMDAYLITV